MSMVHAVFYQSSKLEVFNRRLTDCDLNPDKTFFQKLASLKAWGYGNSNQAKSSHGALGGCAA